ncbi:MAG: IS3 family transposase [Clostridia bacterium]|nr:IS3 family transposase [Clostridia bacterium]
MNTKRPAPSETHREAGLFHADRERETAARVCPGGCAIDDCIRFCNHDRIQLKIKLTPVEFRNQFAA